MRRLEPAPIPRKGAFVPHQESAPDHKASGLGFRVPRGVQRVLRCAHDVPQRVGVRRCACGYGTVLGPLGFQRKRGYVRDFDADGSSGPNETFPHSAPLQN